MHDTPHQRPRRPNSARKVKHSSAHLTCSSVHTSSVYLRITAGAGLSVHLPVKRPERPVWVAVELPRVRGMSASVLCIAFVAVLSSLVLRVILFKLVARVCSEVRDGVSKLLNTARRGSSEIIPNLVVRIASISSRVSVWHTRVPCRFGAVRQRDDQVEWHRGKGLLRQKREFYAMHLPCTIRVRSGAWVALVADTFAHYRG